MNVSYNPGDIKINSIILINKDGKGINISALVTQINLYESINRPFITGDITVSDSVGLIESMPLIGEEQIMVDIETPGPTKLKNSHRRGTFLLYKLSGIENLMLKNRIYVLSIVSIEMVTDANCKISKTYKNNLTNTVTSIVTGVPGLNTSKTLEIDPIINQHTFTANMWSPVQTLHYIANHAIGANNNPSFVFFENVEGFKFKTLDSLYQQQRYMEFTRDSRMRGPEETESLMEEYAKVLDMSTKIHHDYLERLKSGFYASSAVTFDIFAKTVNTTERLAFANWKSQSMNKSFPISKNIQALPETVYKTQISSRELYNGLDPLPLEHHLKRMHKVSLLSASTTNIQVFGRLDYTVGQKVKLTIYRDVDYITHPRKTEDVIDEVLSGDYIITALNHNMTLKTHLTNMELSKESFMKEL